MLKRVIGCSLILTLLACPTAWADKPSGSPPVTVLGSNGFDGNSAVDVGGNDGAAGSKAHDPQVRAPGYKGVVEVKSEDPSNPWQPDATTASISPTAITGVTCTEDAASIPPGAVITLYVFPICYYTVPTNNDDPADPKVQIRAFVADYFRRVPLPKPTPEISAKDGGICGVLHSLNLHMQPEVLFQEGATPFGPLTMHVYGVIKVNWGDKNIGTYTEGGADWPHSNISHSWDTSGVYNIDVNANWTATYTVGPYNGQSYTGTLGGITTTGAIPNFRVWQAQAVITS